MLQASGLCHDNTATGGGALANSATGDYNTATGVDALLRNISGANNTATGVGALYYNTASNNTADGYQALSNNTTGYYNTANGFQALWSNFIGTRNAAEGFKALFGNTGSDNVALGSTAGSNLTNGSSNVCIGSGVVGLAGESNTTRIRNVYSSIASARPVYVNSDNKIGTLTSSRRYKQEIKSMDNASEAILALKPVTFRYKKEIDPANAPMFGLIAEDVEKVDRDLVSYNEKGDAETVRYEAVNAMLLNEFLKEHRKVEELEKARADQQSEIAELKQQLKVQAAAIQKVNDQLQLRTLSPQVVENR